MKLNASILALCVCLCVYHTRAASINVQETKLEALDDVQLDNVEETVVKDQQNSLTTNNEDIPINVVDEQVVNENSNDYIPNNDDTNINVKRIEVDLRNPGPPQRQEHETQNPESYADKEKAAFAIKSSIQNAEKVFTEGLQGVSNSFKTLFSPEENLPLIRKSIENLKETFTGEIDKINYSIRAQLKPESIPFGQTSENNIEVAESRLKVLEKNFKTGVDALSEGIEMYSIIKEDEAGKALAVKADIVNSEDSQPSSSSPQPATQSSTSQPFTSVQQWMQIMIQNLQNGIGNALNSMIPVQASQSQTQASPPPNVQSDTIFGTSIQNPTQNNLGQNLFNQTVQNFQNFFSYFNPIKTTTSAPTSSSTKKPESDVSVQSDNTAPSRTPAGAPAQPQQVQAAQAPAAPVLFQPGPIQQLLQNNPIVKVLQNTFQGIQSTPNPETPREEVVQDKTDTETKDGDVDSKGHYGGHGPNNGNNANQGGTNDSSRVEEKVDEDKAQNIPSAEEKINAEQLKTPAVSDKTE